MNREVFNCIMAGMITGIIIGYAVLTLISNKISKKKKDHLIKCGYKRVLLNSKRQYGYVKNGYKTIDEEELEMLPLRKIRREFK